MISRRLFLFVFLWTCACLVIFRTSLFSASFEPRQQQQPQPHGERLTARAASSDSPLGGPSLEPEFALADQQAGGALYYSLAGSEPQQQQRRQQARKQPDDGSAAKLISKNTNEAAAAANVAAAKSVAQQQPLASSAAAQQCHYDYPSLYDLQFNNVHWQKMTTATSADGAATTKRAAFYLYNAYYDDRWRGGAPSVRILAMIDRIEPPPTNCLLWSKSLTAPSAGGSRKQVPLVVRAKFVYAWYPKWGNYRDGALQPYVVTCPLPRGPHVRLVPDSISLVGVAPEVGAAGDEQQSRRRRDASLALPPPFSSPAAPSSAQQSTRAASEVTQPMQRTNAYDCARTLPVTNNLQVHNWRPAKKQRFAVCVKGLDFPRDDISVRLVEWIELLNLLGASKVFLYELNVHENVSKVLRYYQKRGLVELQQLTLPGDQPNLPEYQHLYLKSKLTEKRQNELIPYNDCLYRNLYAFDYLALLDVDEIIMPLGETQLNWHELMGKVEQMSLREQNYSRASYNVRNVYFFDDLSGPLGTTTSTTAATDADEASDAAQSGALGATPAAAGESPSASSLSSSLERGIPHYLHMMSHVYRSKNYTEAGQYVKCFHNTERVVSLHNHFPMNCFGQCTTYSIPVKLAHLQHYRKDCVGPLKQSCKSDYRAFTTRDTTIWKYKQRMIKRTTRVLNHLGLLAADTGGGGAS